MSNASYFLITESALDLMLIRGLLDQGKWPADSKLDGLYQFDVCDSIVGFATSHEPETPYFALIAIEPLRRLTDRADTDSADIYRRIVRVVKGLKNPPIHLPRGWAEYHHKNLIAFFATPRTSGGLRWVAETDSENLCVRFAALSSKDAPISLVDYAPTPWPQDFITVALEKIEQIRNAEVPKTTNHTSLVEEVDLQVIGSGSVVKNRTYEDWRNYLSEEQKKVVSQAPSASVRIIGPAGSGKTLALCLRAIKISRDQGVVSKGEKILMVTHSWAMTERIDGILSALNGGLPPQNVTIFPLISLLQLHTGHIGQQTEIIGDDSSAGRLAAIEIIRKILRNVDNRGEAAGLSTWISEALVANADSRARAELLFNLHEEFSGVLSANSVALDDADSIRTYLNGKREEWMPPFESRADRNFVLRIYKDFIRTLVDRASITTDQFVLDAIRVLETFTWRMRRETEGYDYILVDELQLFNAQERSALELLGRTGKGVPFTTAEDPSQGVFSALHSGRAMLGVQESVYLDAVHRFDSKIFDLIKYIYQKFPLNTIPLKIDSDTNGSSNKPTLTVCDDDSLAVQAAVALAATLFNETSAAQNERICLATLGDVDEALSERLTAMKLPVVQLAGIDDVEQLSYRKRCLIVAPWQFIGGTQFSHVIVVAAGLNSSHTGFGRLRELTSVYLACSRAAKSLDIICGDYVPTVIEEAKELGLVHSRAG